MNSKKSWEKQMLPGFCLLRTAEAAEKDKPFLILHAAPLLRLVAKK